MQILYLFLQFQYHACWKQTAQKYTKFGYHENKIIITIELSKYSNDRQVIHSYTSWSKTVAVQNKKKKKLMQKTITKWKTKMPSLAHG